MDPASEARVGDRPPAGRWGTGDLCPVLPPRTFKLPLVAAGDDDEGRRAPRDQMTEGRSRQRSGGEPYIRVNALQTLHKDGAAAGCGIPAQKMGGKRRGLTAASGKCLIS